MMNIIKRCIVHLPFKIDRERASGPNIRPLKMIDAFQMLGYEVTVIEGYSEERKLLIKSAMKKIEEGIKFEFVYSESSTMPTSLTDKDHFPRNINLDFNFFNYCRNYEIPVSLFYRDVYWKYPEYKKETSMVKALLAINFYKYDIRKYNTSIDLLYVPNIKYLDKLSNKVHVKQDELPPGYDAYKVNENFIEKNNDGRLKLFYVGGINAMYDLTELFEVVSKNPDIVLQVITREAEWNQHKHLYEQYLGDNILINHAQGDEIKKYYEWADLLMLTTKPNEYRKMAVPIKLFEYIGFEKPIITYNNSYTGEYVARKNIGLSVDYGTGELEKILKEFISGNLIKEDFKDNLNIEKNNNTWIKRAEKVVEDMREIAKKKVMILSDASNSHTRKWAKQTIEEGYNVVVVSLNKGNVAGCKVYDFSEDNQQKRGLISKLKYLTHIPKIKKIINLEKPDIIHAHYASSYGLLAYLTGEPYYLNVWGKDVYEFPNKNFITASILKKVLNGATKVYSTSNVMKTVTQEFTKREIEVTPFGVEIDVFKPKEVNKNEEQFHIGYIKLIEKKYGVEDLIEAFNHMVQKYDNQTFKLTIVGKGTLKDVLVDKVKSLNIDDLVSFIDYVDGVEKVADLYNTFDICVFPSVEDSESFGVSAVESMSCGTPTIVSDVSGFKEITNNGEIAVMFERGNVKELIDAIEMLYLDPNLRKKMSEKSRQHVIENYNVKENFVPVFKAYREELK